MPSVGKLRATASTATTEVPPDAAATATAPAPAPSDVVVRRESRQVGRRSVYLGEGLRVRLSGDTADLTGEVIDLSPEGLGIAVLASESLPRRGDVVTIEHHGRGTVGLRHRARVTSVTEGVFGGRRLPRIGVALLAERTTRSARDRRASERYACSETIPAMANAVSPLFFREWLHFAASELGAGGMTATTSLRNKGLLPGLELDLQVTLPMIGVFPVRAAISSIGRDIDDAAFRVGIRWVEPSRDLLQAIAEYLLLGHKELTPSRLRRGGLPVGSVERAVTYDYARRDEYPAVLALRLRSHQHDGRLDGLTPEDMQSPFDAHARHLVCRFGEQVVGYVRVIFVDRDPSRSQYVAVGGHVVPDWLWETGFVEAGAGATDPEFQRAGLFLPLMQHAARVALQSGYRYLLGACDDELLAMYQHMGFVVLETRTVEPKPGWTFRSHLIVLDVEEVPEGGKFVDAMAAVAAFVSPG